MIASCIHRISYRTMHGRQASKNIVLMMPYGWTAIGGVGVRRSDRCKAKWTYGTGWSGSKAAVQVEHQLNLERQIVEMATRIDRRFLATSDPYFPGG